MLALNHKQCNHKLTFINSLPVARLPEIENLKPVQKFVPSHGYEHDELHKVFISRT